MEKAAPTNVNMKRGAPKDNWDSGCMRATGFLTTIPLFSSKVKTCRDADPKPNTPHSFCWRANGTITLMYGDVKKSKTLKIWDNSLTEQQGVRESRLLKPAAYKSEVLWVTSISYGQMSSRQTNLWYMDLCPTHKCRNEKHLPTPFPSGYT